MTWGFFISNQFKKHDPLLSVFSVPIKTLRKILTKRGFYGNFFKNETESFQFGITIVYIPNWKLRIQECLKREKTVRSLYLIFSAKLINRYVLGLSMLNTYQLKKPLNLFWIFTEFSWNDKLRHTLNAELIGMPTKWYPSYL